jgi:ribose transport system substrate-binding protein
MAKNHELNRREFLQAVAATAGGLAVTTLLPGCGQGGEATIVAPEVGAGMVDTTAYKKDKPWNIGRAGAGDTNAWMVSFSAHFEYSFTERYADEVENYYVTAANWDPTKQISDVEDLLTKGIDLLIIDPVSEAAMVGAVEDAMDAGTPVLLASTRVQTDKYVSWVTTNNVRTGFTSAEWLGKEMGGKGKVAITMGAPGSSYAAEWLGGIRQGLALYPDIEEVGLAYAFWSPVEAKKAWEAFLQADPDIAGVVPGGGLMGIGAVQAFVDAGLPIPPVGGADDGNGWLRIAKENNVKFIGVKSGSPMASTIADIAIKVLSGEPVAKYVEFPTSFFDQDDVDELYRPDLNDQYWASSNLPDEWIEKLYAN